MGYSLLEESRRTSVGIGDYPFNEIQTYPGIVTTGYSWVHANPVMPNNTISRQEAQKIADAKTDELPAMKVIMGHIKNCAELGGYKLGHSSVLPEFEFIAIISRLKSLGFTVDHCSYADERRGLTISWN